MPAASNLLLAARPALNPARPAAALHQVAVSACVLLGSALLPYFQGRKCALLSPPPLPSRARASRFPSHNNCLPDLLSRAWTRRCPSLCRGGAQGQDVVGAAVAAAQLEPAGIAALRAFIVQRGPAASARRHASPPGGAYFVQRSAAARRTLSLSLSAGPASSPACPPTTAPPARQEWLWAGGANNFGGFTLEPAVRDPERWGCAPSAPASRNPSLAPRLTLLPARLTLLRGAAPRDRCISLYLGGYALRFADQPRFVLPAAIRRWVREPTGFCPARRRSR